MATKYYFTDEMLQELKELYPHTLTSDLAKKYNCSVPAVYNRAHELGLKKTKEFVAELSRKFMEDPNHPGRKYQFKKGQTPPNKGKKQTEYMSGEAIKRTKATRFKKGDVPPNHVPIGHKRVTVDGYVEVKVRDGCGNRNFELKHRLVWEKNNGKVPEGYNIQFKDGNRQNCSIENLYMISRTDQISENTIHRYPDDLKKAIKLTSKLKKHIDKYESKIAK